MLKDKMWNIFKANGNINAFLYYKDALKIQPEQKKDVKDKNYVSSREIV